MKTVRAISLILAAALFVTAFLPFASGPSVAYAASLNSPVQAFSDAARGLPLLAPMSLAMPVISVSTSSASSGYSCTFIKQTPLDWTKMRKRQSFDVVWTVENSGAVWHASSTKLAYVGGTKLQSLRDSYKLSNDVGRGKRTKLVVDMIAPRNVGTYSTLWSLYAGSTRFCNLTLTITVTR